MNKRHGGTSTKNESFFLSFSLSLSHRRDERTSFLVEKKHSKDLRMTRTIAIRPFLYLIVLFLGSTISFHLWLAHYLLPPHSLDSSSSSSSLSGEKKVSFLSARSNVRSPVEVKCPRGLVHRVSFTFDDGPHPLFTPSILEVLRHFHLSAGFFLLGTSIQSYLSYHNLLNVHQFERPRIGYLLLQNYSSLEELYRGHFFYLHGWLHEKNTEMRLQTVIDNISTQLLEIGLLQGFRPIYRAPWGLGTSPGHVQRKSVLVDILDQIGVVPAYWKIDTKDFLFQIDEEQLINHTLHRICQTRGGIILMHDNRPQTAALLSRLIRSILLSGHRIVSPHSLESQWNNLTLFNLTRQFTRLLRERVKQLQLSRQFSNHLFRPVQLSLFPKAREQSLLLNLNPLASFKGNITVQPNLQTLYSSSSSSLNPRPTNNTKRH